jgi:hypothetical protein
MASPLKGGEIRANVLLESRRTLYHTTDVDSRHNSGFDARRITDAIEIVRLAVLVAWIVTPLFSSLAARLP